MTSKDIREKYIQFFIGKGHKEIAPARLVPENDPSTLFTSSGMQALVPYLLGEKHPAGKRLVNSQPCFRAEDIEEIGDNRHTTFFEMLGNWSLGDYFKKEQLPWIWEFLTKELGLPKEKLYVSVFEGNRDVPKDVESYEIWKSLDLPEDHIFFYGVDKNWWSRSGTPDKMPVGEIGGPDSEIFYEFTQVEDNPYAHYNRDCHPNCECGRFLEIGNSVFIQYIKKGDGSLEELLQKNVDFGGGLERLTAAVADQPDIFQTDLYLPITDAIVQAIGINYGGDKKPDMQIIADHMKAATFLIVDGVIPSNKLQGYVLRRLLRRSAVKLYELTGDIRFINRLSIICNVVIEIYDNLFNIKNDDSTKKLIQQIILDEISKFGKNIQNGMNKIRKIGIGKLTPEFAFDLYQSNGFPPDLTFELLNLSNLDKDRFIKEFENYFKGHQEQSRTASAGMFKGGLADHSEIVTKYHTATHLLHQALRDVLGPEVFQKGSNITSERLRFDFSFDRKMTDEEIKQVEDLVNKKIEEDLKVDRKIVSPEEAKKMNAIGLFDEKYGSEVSIYGIGPREKGGYYSLEICGGPHVEHTGVIGNIQITKEEAVSAGIRRIRAEIVLR